MFHNLQTMFTAGNLKSTTTIMGAMFASMGGATYAFSPDTPPMVQVAFYTVGIFLFLIKENQGKK